MIGLKFSKISTQNLRVPLKMSFLRKQESISFWHNWTPAYAGVTNLELLEVALRIILTLCIMLYACLPQAGALRYFQEVFSQHIESDDSSPFPDHPEFTTHRIFLVLYPRISWERIIGFYFVFVLFLFLLNFTKHGKSKIRFKLISSFLS